MLHSCRYTQKQLKENYFVTCRYIGARLFGHCEKFLYPRSICSSCRSHQHSLYFTLIDLMLNDVILWSRELKCLKMVVLLNILMKERISFKNKYSNLFVRILIFSQIRSSKHSRVAIFK